MTAPRPSSATSTRSHGARGRHPARVRAIVAEATRRPEATSVRSLAARLGLGERQVERELARHVGLGPKMLLRIARFQRAVALARADASLSLSALAARTGYFDQSHLTHEFRRFAASTPADFLARDSLLTEVFLEKEAGYGVRNM